MKNKYYIIVLLSFFTLSCQKENTEVLFDEKIQYHTLTDDRDGKIYKTVEINNQTWMAQNLAYDPSEKGNSTPPIYGYFYSSPKNSSLCPTGWHIPSREEYQSLIDYLGGRMIAGKKMKEAGNNHWERGSTIGTNSSGFSALPAGIDNWYDGIIRIGEYGCLWTSTPNASYTNYYLTTSYNSDGAGISQDNYETDDNFSIRCMKDN
jgi:uncharacterized protein (TIGR02145 family)